MSIHLTNSNKFIWHSHPRTLSLNTHHTHAHTQYGLLDLHTALVSLLFLPYYNKERGQWCDHTLQRINGDLRLTQCTILENGPLFLLPKSRDNLVSLFSSNPQSMCTSSYSHLIMSWRSLPNPDFGALKRVVARFHTFRTQKVNFPKHSITNGLSLYLSINQSIIENGLPYCQMKDQVW